MVSLVPGAEPELEGGHLGGQTLAEWEGGLSTVRDAAAVCWGAWEAGQGCWEREVLEVIQRVFSPIPDPRGTSSTWWLQDALQAAVRGLPPAGTPN